MNFENATLNNLMEMVILRIASDDSDEIYLIMEHVNINIKQIATSLYINVI